MNIAIGQGMKRFKLFDSVDLKAKIRVGIDWSTSGAADIDDLIAIFFYAIQLNPGNMMFDRMGWSLSWPTTTLTMLWPVL